MQLRIKRNGFFVAFTTYTLILLNYHCLYLFDYPGIFESLFNTYLELISALFIVGLSLYCIIYKKHFIRLYDGWLKKYLILLLISWILMFLFSIFSYDAQSIIHTLRIGSRFLYPLLAIPIIYLFVRDGGTEPLFKFLNILTFIWYLIIIIARIEYSRKGIVIFNLQETFSTDVIAYRSAGIRLTLQAFGNIMILYNVACISYLKKLKKEKIFSVIQCILGIFCVVFIQQTRMYIIVDSICIATILLLQGGTRNRQIFKFIFIVSISMFIIYSPFVRELVQSFSSTDFQYEAGSIARNYTLFYYIQHMINSPIFGIGWAFEKNYFLLLHGAMGYAYTSDVGFLGLLIEYGIFAIVFFVWPVIHMINVIRKRENRAVLHKNPFVISIIIYLLLTSLTLIITDSGRIIAFPVILAMFEYYRVKNFDLIS